MISPDQAVYDLIFQTIDDLTFKAYPFIPPEGTTYPFVRMGETQLFPQATKSNLVGTVIITLDVWGDRTNRKLVSDMATAIMVAVGSKTVTKEGYQVMLDHNESTIELMTDSSTTEDLWRARMTLYIKFF